MTVDLAPVLKAEVVGVVRMIGYFDESEDPDVFAMAGVFGAMNDWKAFESDWQSQLDKYPGLEELKMSDLVQGRDYWRADAWKGRIRLDIQKEFLNLFSENSTSTPIGMTASIDLTVFPPQRDREDLVDWAWMESFNMILHKMCISHLVLGQAGEDLALVFDWRDGVRGHAQRLVDRLNDKWLGGPLVSVTFADSKSVLSLQAADMLVYEARRLAADTIRGGNHARWQWQQLADAQIPHVGQSRLSCEHLRRVDEEWVDPRTLVLEGT